VWYNMGMNNAFLTRDDIVARVPSALASTHDGRRSDLYTFVPTLDIINSMESNGWGVVAAKVPKARKSASRDFGIHQLEFQERGAVALVDPRVPDSKAIFPRIHILNSHNGTSRFQVLAGLYTLVCSNGLIVSTASVGEFSTRHTGSFNAEDAFRTVEQFRAAMSGIGDTMQLWSGLQLSPTEADEFALAAARIRWNDPADAIPSPAYILAPHREADVGRDLWRVFNVAQENLIGGGFKRATREARKVTNLRESIRINSELWNLAETTAMRFG